MIEKGFWGDWEFIDCPAYSYINGGKVRIEDGQGDGDDSSLNGLIISCKNPSTGEVVEKLVNAGHWGNWKTMVSESS